MVLILEKNCHYEPLVLKLGRLKRKVQDMGELMDALTRYAESDDDTSILHHAFMLIFIALWAVILLCGTIFMPFLSYFAMFI